MCIIIYKAKDTKAKIEWNTLKTCFTNNPDGAGYAIAYDNKLLLKKGFMKFEDFETSLRQTIKNVDIEKAGILFHFRITTHGGTSRENTHPFPLGRDSLTDRKYTNLEAAIAMNGICLSNTGYKSAISDTMDAIESLINPLFNMYGAFWKDKGSKSVFDFLGAKWAILEKNGDVTSFGNFHTLQGWTYSNYSYIERKVTKWDYSYTNGYGTTYYYPTNNCTVYDIDTDDDFETTKDDKTYYDLGLMEYTGKVMDLRSNSIKEVTAADNYYLDEDGELYQYSWDDDDFYYDNNLVPIS